ncbi:MAG TPA: rhodanese-like domain-containing protein [Candidatus Marinimicrobia bacterium]|nr:MAG: hypothetical protein AUJ47_07185 [Candidatus Marinimicrobia bacterium CG1_02_48_14]PIZ69315.1 MAG: rhodanese-like domain-containing protein [Candidatus Marinimicrobia bacterium CG_4_10_14_0_2_um_filter_48_9]PJA54351.1 MAG: rhodanese-like domain-containing protein [Candidatus Marinimicrobia bacterium CG_4_9_14_3_um_filter_48_9]HCW77118.1 rhodanese-like domain-containing protein [Candidatus Neomarinimicrobiota bacterium]
MRKSIIIITIFLFASLVVLGFLQSTPAAKFPNISAPELKAKLDMNADLVLLDVRTHSEWDGPLGHLSGALLIPLQELNTRFTELSSFKTKEIVVYCRSGNRSQVATAILRQKGFNAINMLGGMKEWRALLAGDTNQVVK